MLRLLCLLLLPGYLMQFLVKKDRIKNRNSLAKNAMDCFVYSYIILLVDIFLILFWGNERYEDLLFSFGRRMNSVQEFFLFTLLLFIQVLIACVVAVLKRLILYKDVEKAFLTMSQNQKDYTFGVVLASTAVMLLAFSAKENAEQSLVINEICSKNDSVIKDQNGDYPDYIEIYNPSKWDISLKGFILSDQEDVKKRITLNDDVIPAKGHYVVYLSEGKKKTTFGISSKGENVYLTNYSGKVLDMVEVPKMERNISYARATDADEIWMEEEPSPGVANNLVRQHLEEPIFSADSGFYDDEFYLSLQAGEGKSIYYTLDCNVPDRDAILYEDEILVKNVCKEPNVHIMRRNVVQEWDNYNPAYGLVDKVFVVRAVAMDDYGNKSDVVTKTYFVDMEEYQDINVVSVVADPDDLFGDNGIYVTGREYDEWYAGDRGPADILVNFLKKGRAYEINGHLTMLNNNILMDQEVGLRIQGASLRLNPLKRFSIYARKEYSGSRYFECDLFGKDTHAMFTRGDIVDSMLHDLVKNRDIGTQKAVPIKMFLDGEFWYDTHLREKYNEDYLSAVYNVPRDKVEIFERVPSEVVNFLEIHDLSKTEDYQKFCEMIDVDSYIEYMAINIYACNMDLTEKKNYRAWRTTEKTEDEYGDQRIRWLLYDMDYLSWSGADSYEIDSFSEKGSHADVPMNEHVVYKALRMNEEFRKKFVLTFMDIANETFSCEKVSEQIAKWGYDISWKSGFFEKRFNVIVPALAKEFELQGSLEEITLNVNNSKAGYVQINTVIPQLGEDGWNGMYYTDYPVMITAIANEGYKFVGWKCGEEMIKDARIEVQLAEGGCQWEAIFE